jgi:hypothetical protein
MSDFEVPVPEMSQEDLLAYLNTVEIKPPHIVFDQEKYDRDVADGLITGSRNTRPLPYLASELKAAHGAASINVVADVGKPVVVIATTIAYNWSPTYIQKCADAYCYAYGLPLRSIEVINLDANGNKVNDPTPTATQPVLDAIDTWVSTNGTLKTVVTANDRPSLSVITNLPITLPGFTPEQNDMFGWLGELILNFWAIGMNPNAHFRVVCSHNAIGTSLNQAIVYASTDANFPVSSPTHYVNMSWGDSTPGFDRASLDDSIFINPRICYFAAAGNYRWAGYPATSSNVLCVGGARLLYDSTPMHVNVWGDINTTSGVNDNAAQGGGTGFSHSIAAGSNFYQRPSYQYGLSALSALPNNNRRACPDMCSLGDPYTGLLIIFPGGSGENLKFATHRNGGTSLASPLLCGLFSHLSQRRINAGVVPLTTRMTDVGSTPLSGSQNLQDFVYSNFRNSHTVASSMFYDITTGATTLPTNTNLGPENSGKTFAAASGYDIATGLGFPLLQGIMNRMFPVQTVNQGVGVPTINPITVQGLLTPRAVFNFNQPQ